ncbi:MAG: outer membrane beta-barrel protein [Burkholderiales bacterium]
MNRKWPAIVAGGLLSLFVSQLHAEGLYLGAAIGKAGIKDNINTETFDSNDAAYKAFIGWRFKVPLVDLAIEGAYTDFGKPSQTVGAQRVQTKLHGPSLAGLAILPLGPIDLYGKAGAINWSADTTIAGSTTSKSGTDTFYGLGVGFTIWKLGLRAEYERFQVQDVDRVDLFSLSALFQF